MYIMQRTLDKKTAKLTQLQGSCPRAKSVASFYFFNSSFIRINRLACCGSLGILPLLNDAKTWSDQPQKSPEHLFGKTAERVAGFLGITCRKVVTVICSEGVGAQRGS